MMRSASFGIAGAPAIAIGQIVAEGDPELAAGLQDAETGVPCLASRLAAGAGRELAARHMRADVALDDVGGERDVRVIEDPQQLRLVGYQAFQQPVECRMTGSGLEEGVEPGRQPLSPFLARVSPIAEKQCVIGPDLRVIARRLMVRRAREQLVNEPLRMDPTQSMAVAGVELRRH